MGRGSCKRKGRERGTFLSGGRGVFRVRFGKGDISLWCRKCWKKHKAKGRRGKIVKTLIKARKFGTFSISSRNYYLFLFSQRFVRSALFILTAHALTQVRHSSQTATLVFPGHLACSWSPSRPFLTRAPKGYSKHPDLMLSLRGTHPSHGSPLALRGNPRDLVIESLQGSWARSERLGATEEKRPGNGASQQTSGCHPVPRCSRASHPM